MPRAAGAKTDHVDTSDSITAVPVPLAVIADSGATIFESAPWREWCAQAARDASRQAGQSSVATSMRHDVTQAALAFLRETPIRPTATTEIHGCPIWFSRRVLSGMAVAMVVPIGIATALADPSMPVDGTNVGNGPQGHSNGSGVRVEDDHARRATTRESLESKQLDADVYRQTLEMAVRNFGLRLWGYDPHLEKGWYSPHFGQMQESEYQEWDMKLETATESIRPEDHKRIIKGLRELIERDVPYDIELGLNLDGRGCRRYRSCATAIRSADGKVIRIVGAVQDIDEERRRDEALSSSEERFRTLCDHAPVLIAIGNERGEVHQINQAWLELTGATPAMLHGSGWQRFIRDEDRSDVLQAFACASTVAANQVYRVRIRGEDGRARQFLAKSTALPGRNASERDVVLVAMNVTSQLESAKRLEMALESANAGIWDWHVDGGTFVSSAHLHTILGESQPQGEQSYQWFIDRVHPEDANAVFACIERAHRDESFEYNQEFRMRHADGGYRWIRSSGRVVERDGAGNATRMIGLHVDVTERKEAERALQSALREATDRRQRLTEILRYAPAAIAIFDEKMRFLELSERWRQDYGLADVDVIGKSVYDVMEIPQRWRDVHTRCLAGATESCEEDSWIKPDGERKWERWSVRPWIDVATNQIGGLAIFTEDLSNRKRAEAELAAQLEKFAHVSRVSLADQIGIDIAHEIRHPIGVLVNQIYLVSESVAESLGREHPMISDLQKMEATVLRMSDLVDNLRRFSARRAVSQQTIKIRALIAGSLPLVSAKAQAAGVRIEVHGEADLGAVQGDLLQLQQVLVNVLCNAIESIASTNSSGGWIKICARRMDLTHIGIVVTDSGSGIRAADVQRVFDRFVTTKPDGLGLGLSICKDIVESHGGEIRFLSTVPSRICIELPVAAGESLDEPKYDPHRG